MRILLLGEYSSVQNNLAAALIEKGHDVVLANDGDNYKNYKRDIDLAGKHSNIVLRNLERIYKESKFAISAKGFDVVQLMSPLTFSRFGLTKSLHSKLKQNNGKLFFLAAGDDYFYWLGYRNCIYKYGPHQGMLSDLKIKNIYYEGRRSQDINKHLLDIANGVISCAVDYYIAYKDFAGEKLTNIPFPVNVKNIVKGELQAKANAPLKILHGIQSKRMGFKGSNYFIQALKELKDYSSYFTYKEVRNLPYAEYQKELKECDILFDQVNGYSPGMNAIEAMSYGKVVFGGCEDEYKVMNQLSIDPLINVRPNVEFIKSSIVKVLTDSDFYLTTSAKAKEYVFKKHDANVVADQYLSFWEKAK